MEGSKTNRSSLSEVTVTLPAAMTPPSTNNNTSQDQVSQTAPTFPRSGPSLYNSNSNKRKACGVDIRNTPYYKIRALVRDLRPHFIEVLRTPDFQNCKAADEIRKQMKLLMDLHKQMTGEAESVANVTSEPLSSDGLLEKESRDSLADPNTEKTVTYCSWEKKPDDGGQIRGTYVVGGSVFGWNFITYPGSKPTYTGVTKESYKICHPKAELADMQTTNISAEDL